MSVYNDYEVLKLAMFCGNCKTIDRLYDYKIDASNNILIPKLFLCKSCENHKKEALEYEKFSDTLEKLPSLVGEEYKEEINEFKKYAYKHYQ